MGTVHLALDAEGRAVAVKVLRPHLVADGQGRSRLAREVEALRLVVGQHVAEVLDADVEAPSPYLVMRYVQGRSLTERVERNGPVRGEELLALATGLARALVAIHGVGVVHRDLKPGNVLLADGEPVVVDFGLAQLVDDTRLTATGMLLGTPGYLAPEALAGAPAAPAADVHGLGATLVYAATGHPPYGTGPFEVVLSRVMQGEPDLDDVPEHLRTLLRRTLARDPDARPDADELLDALTGRERDATTQVQPVATTRLQSVPNTRLQSVPTTRLQPVAVEATGPRTPPTLRAAAFPPAHRPPDPTSLLPPQQWVGVLAQERDAAAQGRERHPLLLLCAVLLLVGIATLLPGAVLAAALGASVLLRTVDGVACLVGRRRAAAGPRRTDVVVGAAATPWRLLVGVLATIASIPAGILGALAPAVIGLALLESRAVPLEDPLLDALLAAGAAGALLATAYGPGSAGLRRGFDRASGGVLPARSARAGAGTALVAAGAVVAALAQGQPVDPWPLQPEGGRAGGTVQDLRIGGGP